MACPIGGPCEPYITQADLCCLSPTGTFPDPCLTDGLPIAQSIIDNAIAAASELVWAKTGRQFGVCEVTIRPCRKGCGPCDDLFFDFGAFIYGWGPIGPAWLPWLDGGIWTNIPPCGCPDECFCSRAEQIPLPYPVCEIIEVQIDGDIVPATGYRVDDFQNLVRTDGGKWPRCQSPADLGEENTFGVTLTYGRPVPELVKLATAELACQFIKLCANQPCQLPQRVSSISRQGVTIGYIDPQEFWRDKRTGIYLVDLAVDTFNPHKLTRKPTIYSPDVGSRWRRTDT